MKKIIISCALAASAIAVGAGTVSAGKPAVQGCLGESVSANAKDFQPYGYNFISQVTPENGFGKGLGNAVQAVQAGLLPDDEYPNTCN
jgi:Na+/H+-dicarboxylate symporter